jgi:hypothetical protein
MRIGVESLTAVLRAADAAGVPDRLLRAAAAELAQLVDLASLADPRRVETLERASSIESLLRQGVRPAQIRQRLGLGVQAYKRARRAGRDSRPSHVV